MALPPITIEELRTIFEENDSSLERTAEHLGMPYSDFAMKWGPSLVPAPTVRAARHRKPPADLGQEWCRKYTIAIRHCENPYWPKEAEVRIEEARVKYEAGTHEIVTGRDDRWFILYLVPRATRTGARKFFQLN